MENLKGLMLWRHDFKNKRDWISICKVLGVPINTVEIELKAIVVYAAENYRHSHDKKIAKELWEEFEEIQMNPETLCIEEEWHGFSIGTFREDIWKWFEEKFNVSVAEDLIELSNK